MGKLMELEEIESLLDETKKSLDISIKEKNSNEILAKLGAYIALLTVLGKEDEGLSFRRKFTQIISTGRWF